MDWTNAYLKKIACMDNASWKFQCSANVYTKYQNMKPILLKYIKYLTEDCFIVHMVNINIEH